MRLQRHTARLGAAPAWRVLLAALVLMLPIGRATATDVHLKADLRDLKVAYLFNFAQFTEWPRERWNPGAEPFVICATPGAGLGDSLSALEGRRLRGSPVQLAFPRGAQEARRCHVLYAEDAATPWLRQLAESPVLVVGNAPAVAAMALSFEVRGDRLRWNANLAAARLAGLRLNSKIVELALTVIDPPPERP